MNRHEFVPMSLALALAMPQGLPAKAEIHHFNVQISPTQPWVLQMAKAGSIAIEKATMEIILREEAP